MSRAHPVFFLGFPRSGTTVTFEAFCRHPSLGWPSAYTEAFPATPGVEVLRRLFDNSTVRLAGKKGQYGRTVVGNRLLPQPNEAYRFWNLHSDVDFARSSLRGVRANIETAHRMQEAVRRLLKWQGRSRFSAKLTGPPRIGFLDSVFPGCQFVHVVRDGRAAVHSLLRTNFWREKGGYDKPFWNGCLSQHEEQKWRNGGRDPGALAALQWSAVLDMTRSEGNRLGADRYRELRYEDFVQAPHVLLREIYQFCDLGDSPDAHAYLDSSAIHADMNQKYQRDFAPAYIEMLTSLMQPFLTQFGYQD